MTAPISIRDLTISPGDWVNEGTDTNHLITILVINGTFHHLEAIRVIEDEDGRQHAASAEFEDIVDGMYLIGGDGPFETVRINGEPYILIVIPFQ